MKTTTIRGALSILAGALCMFTLVQPVRAIATYNATASSSLTITGITDELGNEYDMDMPPPDLFIEGMA